MVIICIVCKLNTRLEIQLLMYLHAIKYISGFFYIYYVLAWTQERAPEEERMAVLGDTMRDLIHEVNFYLNFFYLLL